MNVISTVFRLVVMVATAFACYKGWQIYGPSSTQLKEYASTALGKAQAALSESSASDAADGGAAALPFATPPLAAPAEATQAMSSSEAPQLVPLATATSANDLFDSADASVASAATSDTGTASGDGGKVVDDPLARSLERLERLGGVEASVRTWGATGGFFLCSCQVKGAEPSAMARNFEAIANEPLAAVEQVAAKVEAWRAAQHGELR